MALSAINTLLSFGLLSLSKTPALQAFGLTMLIGTVAVCLVVPCLLLQRETMRFQPSGLGSPYESGWLTGETLKKVEVVIIGAGPAGSVAAALLRQQGRQVLMLEREQFPRFSIGESLLPQSMEYLEQGGMLRAVVEAGFQLKNGAAFARGRQYNEFDFSEKIFTRLEHYLPGAAGSL